MPERNLDYIAGDIKMNRLFIKSIFIFLFISISLPTFAVRLLTQEAALEIAFGKGAKITEEVKTLEGDKLKLVLDRLGGSLYNFRPLTEASDFTFYVWEVDGKPAEVAMFDIEMGKMGPIEFMIVFSLETAVIRSIRVMRHKETRGRPLTRQSFLKQFKSKNINSKLKLRDDIVAISGATYTAKCAIFTAKKAIAVFNALYK